MYKNSIQILYCIVTFILSTTIFAAPLVTGEPVVVQHLGVIDWPQDTSDKIPHLTQLAANDINDLHGRLSCDLIITTPGNYHMALKDAMYGRADLGHVGLIRQKDVLPKNRVNICWTTSPPIAMDHITARRVQFKNIIVKGKPALAMAPGSVMDELVATGLVDGTSRRQFLTNRGNAILIRADKATIIRSICDLGGMTRVVTPNPTLESGSFRNFSGTIFDVADQNMFGCDATELFNSIFTQNLLDFDLSVFDFPHDIDGVMSVFGQGTKPQGNGAKWVASSRIMHRDVPYALCNNEADAAVVFYHLARYMKRTLGKRGCNLIIVPLGGTVQDPQPLPGNPIGKLHIAKVTGNFPVNVKMVRDRIYDFLTTSPVWEQILNDRGLLR